MKSFEDVVFGIGLFLMCGCMAAFIFLDPIDYTRKQMVLYALLPVLAMVFLLLGMAIWDLILVRRERREPLTLKQARWDRVQLRFCVVGCTTGILAGLLHYHFDIEIDVEDPLTYLVGAIIFLSYRGFETWNFRRNNRVADKASDRSETA